MFHTYDHDEYLDILNDLRWNSREAIRLFECLRDTDNGVSTNPTINPIYGSYGAADTSNHKSHDFSVAYHNSIEFRQCMKLLGHHLDKIQNISHEEMDPNIFKQKLRQDRERILNLTAENIAIKKNFLIVQRRISSTYCAMSDNLAGQVTIESQLEDQKQKLKNIKKEFNNFKRDAADAAKTHREEKINFQNLIKRLRSEQDKLTKVIKPTTTSSTVSSKDQSDQPVSKKQKRASPVSGGNGPLNSPIPVSLSGSSLSSSSFTTSTAMRVPSLTHTDHTLHQSDSINLSMPTPTSHSHHINAQTGEQGLPEGTSYIGCHIRKKFEGHGYFTGMRMYVACSVLVYTLSNVLCCS